MKNSLLFVFALLPFVAVCQLATNNFTVTNYQTYVYVKGLRLDSIDSKYAIVWPSLKFFEFYYGQKFDNMRERRLVNKEGKQLVFDNVITLLNLLDYNGWEVIGSIRDNDGDREFLLKKRDK